MNFIKTKRVLKSGKPGTKKYQRIYGNDFICLRNKFDYIKNKKYKTVELIVDTETWQPKPSDLFLQTTVSILLNYNEIDFRKKLISAGGVWDNKNKLWNAPLGTIKKLKLCHRIVE